MPWIVHLKGDAGAVLHRTARLPGPAVRLRRELRVSGRISLGESLEYGTDKSQSLLNLMNCPYRPVPTSGYEAAPGGLADPYRSAPPRDEGDGRPPLRPVSPVHRARSAADRHHRCRCGRRPGVREPGEKTSEPGVREGPGRIVESVPSPDAPPSARAWPSFRRRPRRPVSTAPARNPYYGRAPLTLFGFQ